MASISTLTAPTVKHILIDSLVVMKIVKHVDSELYAGINEIAGESCQGHLSGLVAPEDDRLEITNCFPTARAELVLDDEATPQQSAQFDDQRHSEMIDMLRKFRKMNIDYELVGFYQAAPFGACFNQDLVYSMAEYQSTVVPENVAIIYDPVRTRQGVLSLKAYRLSMAALEQAVKQDWSPESIRAANLTYETVFEEVPITIKSSYLANVLMAELSLSKGPVMDKFCSNLELGTKRSLEKSVRSMMANIDELNKSMQALTKYNVEKQRHESFVYTATQNRQQENETRIANGEAPLSLDDIKKMKPPQLATRNGMLDALLSSCEIESLSDFCSTVTGENMAKLFLAEAISDDKVITGKDRSSSSISRP